MFGFVLSTHKVAGVRQAIEVKGAKIAYLPRYNPDLNLIGQLFAKRKHLLRKTKSFMPIAKGRWYDSRAV